MKNKFLLICLLLLSFSVPSQGLRGIVTGPDSVPVDNALIHLLNTNISTRTDRHGYFYLAEKPAEGTRMVIHAQGYAGTNVALNLMDSSLKVTLFPKLISLDEIVVTAGKKEELPGEEAISLSVLSAEQIEDHQIHNIKDMTAIVPNLYSASPGDKRNVTSIRGITSTSYDPAVATYIDGVSQFSLDTYISDLMDVERVEVLRGPQGSLYGRNAMAGVINIITRQPGNETTGYIRGGWGNYRSSRYEAGLRAPLIKDKLFAGVATLFHGRKGFYRNQFDNTTFDDQNSVAANYFVQYLPSSRWSLVLNIKQQDNQNKGAFPLIAGKENALKYPYTLSQDARSLMMDRIFNGSFSATYFGEKCNLIAQTAYQYNHRYFKDPIDCDFSALNAVTLSNDYGKKWNNSKVLTQEFRLVSVPSEKRVSWIAGLYFFAQDNPVKQSVWYGPDAPGPGSSDSLYSIINTSRAENLGAAAFGQLYVALSRQLNLIMGMRYDHEQRTLSVLSEYQQDGGPVTVVRPDTSAGITYYSLSPKIGLVYQLFPTTSVYLNYSRGYRPGGLTQLETYGAQPPLHAYSPEYSDNFEGGGTISFWSDRVNIHFCGFYTTVTDKQVPTLILPDAITVTRNGGTMSSKGFELGFRSILWKGLSLEYNAGFTDARYERLMIAQNGELKDLAGRKQVFSPEYTSMLGLNYRKGLIGSFHFLVGADWRMIGPQYFDLANTIRQEAYHVLDFRIGVGYRRIDVVFWTKNLTDRIYIDYAYDFGAVHLSDPRTTGLTLSIKF